MSEDDTNDAGMPMGADAQALLRAARTSRHDDPPPQAKSRVRGALALALAGGAAAGVGGASATASASGTASATAGANAGAGLATKALGGLASSSTSAAVGGATVGSATVGGATVGSAAAGATVVGSAAAGAGIFSGLAMKVAIAAITVSAVGGIALVQGAPEARHEMVETADEVPSTAHHAEPAAMDPGTHPSLLEPGVPEPVSLPAVMPELSVPVLDLPEAPPEAPTPVSRPRVERTEAPEAVLEAPVHEEVPVSSTLMAEMALLSPARAAISRGDATAARRLVRDYRARFPSGALAEEFAAIEVEGLCIESDPGAPAARRRFEAAHPTSAYATRIGRACD